LKHDEKRKTPMLYTHIDSNGTYKSGLPFKIGKLDVCLDSSTPCLPNDVKRFRNQKHSVSENKFNAAVFVISTKLDRLGSE